MDKPKAVLLLTRPEGGNTRFQALLSQDVQSQLCSIEHPLITITPLVTSLDLGGADRVIFTSGSAVKIASSLTDQRIPSYCVGRQTTKAACQAGWHAKMLGLDSREFIETIETHSPTENMLHLRGAHTRGNIVKKLISSGHNCGEIAIYDQVLQPVSDEVSDLLASAMPVIVPLFSPRAARHFAKNARQTRNLILIALSDAVASPLESLHYEGLHISKTPEAAAMADIVMNIVAQASWPHAMG